MAENEKELYERLSRQLGLTPEQIKSSTERGDVGSLTQNIDSNRAQQVRSILNDPERAKELLNSPQAQALMKILSQQ